MSKTAKWVLILGITLLGIVVIPAFMIALMDEAVHVMGFIFLCILCFYPAIAMIVGGIAGSDLHSFWFAPFLPAVVFLPYTLWLLKSFVPEMLIYSGIYLVASFAAMGLSFKIFKALRKKKEEKAFMERKTKKKKKTS